MKKEKQTRYEKRKENFSTKEEEEEENIATTKRERGVKLFI